MKNNLYYPLKFEPTYKKYIWGGDNLKNFGRKLPESIIAESWDVSCHKNGHSVIANGPLKGQTLISVISKYGVDIIGQKLNSKYLFKFPLLIKLLDANDNLSIQVHPDDRYAFEKENGEPGKNEMWYIIDAKPGAKIVYGFKNGLNNKKKFKAALEQNNLKEYLNEINVYKGDVIYIPAGTMHGIGKGIVAAEIQQNSDITYRVYDYERVDVDGISRPLHVNKAMDVIDFKASNSKIVGVKVSLNKFDSVKYLISNKYFTVEFLDVKRGFLHNTKNERFYIYTIVNGEGIIKNDIETLKVSKGDSVFIPAATGIYSVEGKFKALRSYIPLYKNELFEKLVEKGFNELALKSKIAGFEY